MIKREVPTLRSLCLKCAGRYAPRVLLPSAVDRALDMQHGLLLAASEADDSARRPPRDMRPALLATLADAGALLDGSLPDGFWQHYARRALSLAGSKISARTLAACCDDTVRMRDATLDAKQRHRRLGAAAPAAPPAPRPVFLLALDLTGCFLLRCASSRVVVSQNAVVGSHDLPSTID